MTINLKKIGIAAIAATIVSAFAVTANAQNAGIITKEQAIEKVFSMNKGLLLEVDLDDHRNLPVYDVNILDGSTVRDYTIDATNGNIIRQKSENINPQRAAILNSVKVNYKDAEKTALEKYPNSTVFDIELKHHAGQPFYKVHVADENAVHYNVTVDAMTGAVTGNMQCEYFSNKPMVTRQAAEERAVAAYPGKVLRTQLKSDDGISCYEVYVLRANNMMMKVKVDGNTGNVWSKKAKKEKKEKMNW